MLPIYIPSRSRFNEIHKGTIKNIPKSMDVSYVVPADQAHDYRKEFFNHDYDWVKVLECPAQGITATRHWIGLTASRLRQAKHVQMDDDLVNFATRISSGDYRLRQSDEEDMLEMFQWVEQALDIYAHTSISPRGNNLIRGKNGPLVGSAPLTQLNVRMIRFYAYQTEPFLSIEHNRVKVMDDFDITLSLLRKGYANIQSHWWSQDQRQTGSPGGCADYRDHAVHEEGARKLAELHPGLVRLVHKKNKATTYNPEFAERTEVIISWKSAYKEGLLRREQEEKRMHNL